MGGQGDGTPAAAIPVRKGKFWPAARKCQCCSVPMPYCTGVARIFPVLRKERLDAGEGGSSFKKSSEGVESSLGADAGKDMGVESEAGTDSAARQEAMADAEAGVGT